MKCIFYVLLVFTTFFSCVKPIEKKGSNTEQANYVNKKEIKTAEDLILKQKLAECYIVLEYKSSSVTKLNNVNYRPFVLWLQKVKKEIINNENNNIIFDIETVVNKDIAKQTADKRIKDVVEIINRSIGIDTEDLPIVKNISYLKWGSRNENYIKISLNALLL